MKHVTVEVVVVELQYYANVIGIVVLYYSSLAYLTTADINRPIPSGSMEVYHGGFQSRGCGRKKFKKEANNCLFYIFLNNLS